LSLRATPVRSWTVTEKLNRPAEQRVSPDWRQRDVYVNFSRSRSGGASSTRRRSASGRTDPPVWVIRKGSGSQTVHGSWRLP